MMYLDAVEKQIAINSMYNDNPILDGTYTDFNELRDKYKVSVSGELPTSGEIIIQNGMIQSATLKVNGYDVTCNSSRVCTTGTDTKNTILVFNKSTVTVTKTGITIPYTLTSNYSDTEVECKYGTDSNNLNQTGTISNGKCIISGLTAGTKYYYKLTVTSNEEKIDEIKGEATTNENVLYTEAILNGADPVYSSNLIPIVIEETTVSGQETTNVTIKKADIYDNENPWYSYENKKWANAVILKSSKVNDYTNIKAGDTIALADIEAYFVWIPKYSYKLFDLGNYTSANNSKPTTSIAHTIDIRFGTTNTSDSNTGECTTPMTSGATGNCVVNDYMTHPAFISMNTNGLWVGKYETTGTTSGISVLPNETSLRNQTIKTFFDLAYNYKRDNDSHMMKNTEWGAVAYLSHSVYGINTEVRINNYYATSGSSTILKTGYAAVTAPTCYNGPTTSSCNSFGTASTVTKPYNTTTGYLASTTENITGIYDMSGGAWEYMAAYRQNTYGSSGFSASNIGNYDSKYFDVYASNSDDSTYNKRILGDATGEMGPFYNYTDGDNNIRPHVNWYGECIYFISSNSPWFMRSGSSISGNTVSSFRSTQSVGSSNITYGFRLVLNN